ncbi:uncharacterized protein F4817DRAFT_341763 [Daldinia loculata]|uniref:uncharacterized protein n=1 Tax=Daldinia loculata TaxID=103429 RepID=UPI0020C3E4A7|nr:uncharacterized protein F4817DRAFT_341763 [Daldinia loculata]KAI1646054.1 hypothetical protein F4817DRAFT_341763 [Daldinia loculata]
MDSGYSGPFFFCCPPVGSAATWVSQPAAIPKFTTWLALSLGWGVSFTAFWSALSEHMCVGVCVRVCVCVYMHVGLCRGGSNRSRRWSG